MQSELPHVEGVTVDSVAADLVKKAEHIKAAKGSYQTIVQEVIVIGGKAMMSKKFSLEQAEYVAAAMIAAITLAKQANNQ